MSRSSCGSCAAGADALEAWLRAALDYIPDWLGFQMRASGQVGCQLAVAHRGAVVLERAFGHADLARGEALTPRHRFRIASHSKTFTAVGVMRLREQGKLALDDSIGRHVPGLHPDVAAATLGQLLSHTAGLTRDGMRTGQFADEHAFASRADILADLAEGTTIPANTRFKYSNHGFALAGMAIEAVTGEAYADWIAREVIEPFGLAQTTPDMPLPPGTPFARGHSGDMPLGRRVVIPGENRCGALAPAAGFASTAGDLARFYGALTPDAASPLSAASRREMLRRQWRNPDVGFELWYGLGTMSGASGPQGRAWEWSGHSCRLQGYVSRSVVVPATEISVSLLINGLDGVPEVWLDGVLQVLRSFHQRGAPTEAVRDWRGRFWTIWGATDLLPVGDRVLMATPAFGNPLMDSPEVAVTDAENGRIVQAPGFGNHGEAIRLERDAEGRARAYETGGMRAVPEEELAAVLRARYGT
jgi:CubicO group peptidase (beta-lactamase class C family)